MAVRRLPLHWPTAFLPLLAAMVCVVPTVQAMTVHVTPISDETGTTLPAQPKAPSPSSSQKLFVSGVTWINIRANTLRHAREGESLMNRQQYAEAIEAFQVGLALNPDSTLAASLYHNMALCYRVLGQYPLAIISHQRALRLAPGFHMYTLHLAQTYKAAGKQAEALHRFQTLLAANPDNTEFKLMVGYLK